MFSETRIDGRPDNVEMGGCCMKKLPAVIFALACCLTLARPACADNGTEVVIADDLTVLGTDGTWEDPDVHIAGFTVFGSTSGTVSKLGANPRPGSVLVTGDLQIGGNVYIPNLSELKPSDLNSPVGEVLRVNSAGSAATPVTRKQRVRLRRTPGVKASTAPQTTGGQQSPVVSSATR